MQAGGGFCVHFCKPAVQVFDAVLCDDRIEFGAHFRFDCGRSLSPSRSALKYSIVPPTSSGFCRVR